MTVQEIWDRKIANWRAHDKEYQRLELGLILGLEDEPLSLDTLTCIAREQGVLPDWLGG